MAKTEKAQNQPAIDTALVAASAEGAIAAVTQAGGAAEALIGAWVKAGNAAAVNEVAERGSGAARKAARRGINVLKSRGVSIPARSSVTRVTGARESEIHEAYMLAPDSIGTFTGLYSPPRRALLSASRSCD